MLNLRFQEKRLTTRRKLNGLLPGKVFLGNQEIRIKPVDVSKDGIGIVTDLQLREGSIVRLQYGSEELELEVMWSKKDFGKRDLFRYGLMLRSSILDLEVLFESTGCLK